MKRITIPARPNLDARARACGFDFHSSDGEPYWDETAYYAFSLDEIEAGLERPSQALGQLCLELVDRACRDERLLERLAIPRHAWDLIAASWRRGDPTLYGRFDLAFGGHRETASGPARLLEYNADTPTTLFEAAVFQWTWLEDAMAQGSIPAGSDQFNAIHEAVVARLKAIGASGAPGAAAGAAGALAATLHLSCMPGSAEDRGFIAYLEACAAEAGLSSTIIELADIGTIGHGPFVDLDNAAITTLFKLYPWE